MTDCKPCSCFSGSWIPKSEGFFSGFSLMNVNLNICLGLKAQKLKGTQKVIHIHCILKSHYVLSQSYKLNVWERRGKTEFWLPEVPITKIALRREKT